VGEVYFYVADYSVMVITSLKSSFGCYVLHSLEISVGYPNTIYVSVLMQLSA